MTSILGLRSKHDASAALIIDGQLIAAAAEERFTKVKHHFGLPENSIRFVLQQAGVLFKDLDMVAVDGLPLHLTVSRLARHPMYAWTPRLYGWLARESLARLSGRTKSAGMSERHFLNLQGYHGSYLPVEHHLAHASYAYRTSGQDESTVIILDGRGHYLGGAIYHGCGGQLQKVGETFAEGGSLGMFYSAVTDALGFRVGDGEGKTMGLACYGQAQPDLVRELEEYAPRVVGLTSRKRYEWQLDWQVDRNRLLGHYAEGAKLRILIDRYSAENLAAAAQDILERRMIDLVRNAVQATGVRRVVAGGGVFLNVKATMRLLQEGIVDSVFVPPDPGDGGLAAGYALEAYHQLYPSFTFPALESPYLGPGFTDDEIRQVLEKADVNFERLDDVPTVTCQLIESGAVIGWFQGRMEWGPRALGNRSVLADPRRLDMRDHINDKLKHRDWFMPFAPSVLEEYVANWFRDATPSPYMNLAFEVLPEKRALVPAVTHVDGTARPQTVNRATNRLYYDTIDAFRRSTGIPMVLNTSFNKHGLPIVCIPQDAVDHLLWGCVDQLIIGSYRVTRRA